MEHNGRNSNPDDNDKAATPPLPPGTPDEIQPPAEPVGPDTRSDWPHHPALHRYSPFDWKQARRAAIFAGLIGGVGSLIPIGIFIALWMLAAGGISITIYRRRDPRALVSAGNGFRMGTLTGLIGFAFNAALTSLGMLSASARSELRASLQQKLSDVVASTPDPAAQQTLHNLADWIATPGGLASMVILSLLFACVFFVVVAGIGGSIGAGLFGKHES